MAHRILELYLNHPSRVLFKMDTDTYFLRRFDYLPKDNGIFGSVQKSRDGCKSIQGDGMGFTLDAARAIWQSNLLLDSRLYRPFDFEDESPYFRSMARRVKQCGLSSFDWMMGWSATELGIDQFDFKEVNCLWRRTPLVSPNRISNTPRYTRSTRIK